MTDNKKIKEIFYDLQNLMENLYNRWCDESEYEDINDYAIPIKKNLDPDVKFLKMTKRPFGFRFSYNNLVFQIGVTGRSYTCKEIK